MGIDNSNKINYYINKLIEFEFGSGSIAPVIGSVAGAVTPTNTGSYFYAIKADGAADVVISAMTYVNGQAVSGVANLTILAGDVLFIPCTSFTLVSGKYIAYQRTINDNP